MALSRSKSSYVSRGSGSVSRIILPIWVQICFEYEPEIRVGIRILLGIRIGLDGIRFEYGFECGFESVLNSVENIGRERKYEYKLRLGIVIFGLQPRCLGRIKPIPSSRVHSPQNTCRILFRAIFPMLAEVPRIGCWIRWHEDGSGYGVECESEYGSPYRLG